MFTKPKNGWTEIHLEEFEGLGSYIQDVPAEAAEGCIRALREQTPLVLQFDEEGSEFTLTAEDTVHIVAQGYYGPEEYEIPMTKEALAREICADLEEYFPDWVEFSEEYAYFEEEEAAEKQAFYAKRERMLQSLLKELRETLQQMA